MSDADKRAFLEVTKQLALALREPALDTPQLRVYFAALRDLEIELVARAAKDLSTAAKYFPKPAEWRAAALAIDARLRREQQELIRKLHLQGIELCSSCGDRLFVENPETNRCRPCACKELRRQELLGRRPWPALPSARASAGGHIVNQNQMRCPQGTAVWGPRTTRTRTCNLREAMMDGCLCLVPGCVNLMVGRDHVRPSVEATVAGGNSG